MKKRVLFTVLFVVMLSLLAVFSVSAEEYAFVDDLGDPDWYTGNYELMTDKTSKVVLSNGDGTYTAYPAYYILKYSITASDGAVTAASISSIDYSFLISKGYSYEAGAIYKIEFPNGLTTISNGIFGLYIKEPNVTEIILSDSMKTIGDHAFRANKNLKRIVLSKNLTSIGAYAFYECSGLEEVVFTPGSDAELYVSKENIFFNCTSLKELNLSTRNIKTLGSSFLSGCTNLGKVTLPESLEEIGYCSIYNCPNLYLASDFLPTNLKTVGFHFLSGCKSINNVLYFPEGFQGFTATYNFSSDKQYPEELTLVFLGKMTGKVPLEMVHTSGRKLNLVFTQNTYNDLSGKFVTASTDGTLTFVAVTSATDDNNYIEKEGTLEIVLGNPKDATRNKVDANGNTIYNINSNCASIYFCGGDNVEVCYNVRTNAVEGSHYNYLTTSFTFDREGHMTAGVHYDLTKVISLPNCGIDGVTEGTCVICDRVAEVKTPATGDHTLSQISPCADKCSVCLLYVQRAEQSHKLKEVFTYANGFDAIGAYDNTCSNEGCAYHATGELDALFTYKGYSAPENADRGEMVIGYTVNHKAISEYERVTLKTLSYGVFAVGEEKLGTNDIFGENGTVASGAITVEITETKYNSFEFKLTGFNDDNKGKALALGAYVAVNDGESTEYSYMQMGTPDEGAKYVFMSYTEYLSLIKA